MDIKEIRLKNLLALADKHGQDIDFCKTIDMNPSYLPQLKARIKSIGDKIARKVEGKLGLPHGFMDTNHEPSELPDTLPNADVMATAYNIESLPKPLRDQFKKLVFQMVAHCRDNDQDENQYDGSGDIQPFNVVLEERRCDASDQVSNIKGL